MGRRKESRDVSPPVKDAPVRASPEAKDLHPPAPPGTSGESDASRLDDKHHKRAHAVCSASSSKMWLNCMPSARLQELFPDETSVYAERGTYVHELGEFKLRKAHGEKIDRPSSEEYDDEDAERNSDLYCEIILEAEQDMKQEHGESIMFIEEKLDFSPWAPEGFGSVDCLLCAPGEVRIFDYKNGHVYVDADHNSQMMLYALGAVNAYDFLFDFQTISMTIVQPNVENISTYTVTKDELLEWGEWVKPRAKMAFNGEGEQCPGDETCRWCRAKAVCEARKQEALALAQGEFIDLDAAEGVLRDDADSEETDATAAYKPDTDTVVFKQPMLIPQDEIERILPVLNRIEDWITAVFAYVANEAIQHGVKWKGYKVVEGRSRRQFTDTKAVVKAAQEAGFTDLYKQEMKSLTEIEKMMGKKTFNTVLGEYVLKPPGKLSLVPESDAREAVDIDGSPSEFDVLEDTDEN